MNNLQLIVYCLASFFLGVALTLKVIFSLAQRNDSQDRSEGCLGNLLALLPLGLALLLFAAGFMSQS